MDAPGRVERELARRLVERLPPRAGPALRWRSSSLRSSAEHLLYTALRTPASAGGRWPVARALGRLARVAAGGHPAPDARGDGPIVVLVTQPIHVELFLPIGNRLAAEGVPWLIVDAETRSGRRVKRTEVAHRLVAFGRRGDVPSLGRHALEVGARLRRPPTGWDELVGSEDAGRLIDVLRRGVPLVALDVARTAAMIDRLRPRLLSCFSESGLLGRLVPAAARPSRVPVVDLPHAEAADPSGSAGIGYDGVAVYGPRAAGVMRDAGIEAARIVEIGPLRHDALVGRSAEPPLDGPRRVIFASQPADEARPHLHPDVKRAALRAAIAAAAALEPAEVVVVPHPIERDDTAGELLARERPPDGVSARIERERALHDVLTGAWVLVTASSQSALDAVVSGVPAMTVTPEGMADPVTFAAEGIAAGVASPGQAAEVARRWRDPRARAAAAAGARRALGERIGPLDGRAAERAAEWLLGVRADGLPVESADT